MTNILTFPDRATPKRNREFLQDGNDTLRFDEVNQQRQYSFSPPENSSLIEANKGLSKDWSNQELADLFRVKRLLDAAGIPNEIDRGITDEGDPWFIFCDVPGNVFIHICRINNTYILDNPNIATPLCGRDFHDLIAQFTQKNLLDAGKGPSKESNPSRQVFNLTRNNNVFLHPATMLAALIWSLYLDSDDMLLILQNDNEGPDTKQPHFTTLLDQTETMPVLSARYIADHEIWQVDHNAIGAKYEGGILTQQAKSLIPVTDEKLSQNPYVIGLSVIALSLGMTSQTHVANVTHRTIESLFALFTDSDLNENTGSPDTNGNHLTQNSDSAFTLEFFLANFDSMADYFSTSPFSTVLFAHDDRAQTVSESASIAKALDEGNAKDQNMATDRMQPDTDQAKVLVLDWTASEAPPLQLSLFSQHQKTTIVDHLFEGALSQTFNALVSSAKEYSLETNNVEATFDITSDALDDVESIVISADEPSSNVKSDPKHNQFDEQAFEFLVNLLDEIDNYEMIAMDGEMILLDADVFEVPAEESMMMSWSLSNGEVISTIGLRSDFEAYDLIA